MGSAVVLFDGHCRLCDAGARRLAGLARPGTIELRDFQRPGVIEAFPGLTHEECMQALILVTPDGRRLRGAEAVAAALRTRPVAGLPAALYYLPGLRQAADAVYAWIARNRYRWFGRKPACDDEACALHR